MMGVLVAVLALLRAMLADNDGGGRRRGAARVGEVVGDILTGGLVAGGAALVGSGIKEAVSDDDEDASQDGE